MAKKKAARLSQGPLRKTTPSGKIQSKLAKMWIERKSWNQEMPTFPEEIKSKVIFLYILILTNTSYSYVLIVAKRVFLEKNGPLSGAVKGFDPLIL